MVCLALKSYLKNNSFKYSILKVLIGQINPLDISMGKIKEKEIDF
jgi:hypothetical protein